MSSLRKLVVHIEEEERADLITQALSLSLVQKWLFMSWILHHTLKKAMYIFVFTSKFKEDDVY